MIMIDKVITGVINFTVGMTLNLGIGEVIINANPFISICGKLAGLIFTIIGIFYMYQAFKYKKEQRHYLNIKKLEEKDERDSE